jgi:hypothetical protein
MIYVIDTCSLRMFGSYFPERFPTFWSRLQQTVDEGSLISVKEVRHEIEIQNTAEWVKDWVKRNKKIFVAPTQNEATFLTVLFQNANYRQLIGKRQVLQGCPVADPYLVAAAHSRKATVVTQEVWKANSSKLPNICEGVGLGCLSLNGFMEAMRWSF